jgi:hypothetical protein
MATDQQIIAWLTNAGKIGAEVTIAPHDWLNPGSGYAATLKIPSDNSKGYRDVVSDGETGIAALSTLVRDFWIIPSSNG